MSIITIHCRLIASEPFRRHLWHLMAESNTPLINDLLQRVSKHPDFETWQRTGTVPKDAVKELCKPLRAIYSGQPGRFYASAIAMVETTYGSWLALQQSRRHRLDGKQRWLNVVKSDPELVQLSGSTLEVIRNRAQEILNQLDVESKTQANPKKKTKKQKADTQANPKKKTKKQKADDPNSKDLMSRLFKVYEDTEDTLSRCAIAHLLKNDCKVSETEEDPERFAHRIRRKQEEIERLEAQLTARLPKGRDLTGEKFLETLAIATQQIPESDIQTQDWQAQLLARPKLIPYPIIYGSATDVSWGKTSKERIAVNFNGLEKYFKAVAPDTKAWINTHKEYPFQLYCDQRQLPFFQRFLEDWQAYQANKDTYPPGLLTLRSALLAWREGKGKGDPWKIHHLTLYCSFETRSMTAEGTLEVQQEKLATATKKSTCPNSDSRLQTTLTKLQSIPERPSQKPYQGNPEILLGLSIGLANPITAAVVNGRTGEVLTYRTPRTLLGDRYRLFNRQRQQKQQNALQRHKNQKRGVIKQPSEAELGQYVDRLLAKSIIQLAQTYQASSIVIPSLTHLRELLASEITAKAKQKCPGSAKAQDQYAKAYRISIHQWSYSRLIKAICSKAQQLGIPVESEFQPNQGNSKEQAKDIAIAAYHFRAIATK